jgi:hypothetical protein
MPLDSRLHGKNGRIQMDPAGGVALVTLGDLTSWTLDMATDRVDVTAFGTRTNAASPGCRISPAPSPAGGTR